MHVHRSRKIWTVFFAAALLAALSGAAGYRMGVSSAVAPVGTIPSTDDAIKARMLMEAMDYVGVCSPEAAAETWAQGLMRRSAAIQYAVMDDDLRARYARALEKSAPNWITGVSSPWVSAYTITRRKKTGPDTYELTLSIETATSAGPAQTLRAVLTAAYRSGFWRVTDIRAEEALQAYTGMPAEPPSEAE